MLCIDESEQLVTQVASTLNFRQLGFKVCNINLHPAYTVSSVFERKVIVIVVVSYLFFPASVSTFASSKALVHWSR